MLYIIIPFLGIISIVVLIKSIRNKDINIAKNILLISIIYLAFFLINFYIIPFSLGLDIGLEFLLLIPIKILAEILYVVSIITCIIKIKKLNNNENRNTKIYRSTLVLIISPILIFILLIFRELIILNNSNLILVYHDSGNGGIGDSKKFVYAIEENYCKKLSIGASYLIENFFIKPSTRLEVYDYDIEYNSNDEYILKYSEYFSAEKNLILNEIKNELDYLIKDIKSKHSQAEDIYISYLKGTKYYIIKSHDIDGVLIYKDRECIQKINNLSGNISIEDSFYFY